jgi:hypothetical protein
MKVVLECQISDSLQMIILYFIKLFALEFSLENLNFIVKAVHAIPDRLPGNRLLEDHGAYFDLVVYQHFSPQEFQLVTNVIHQIPSQDLNLT